MTSELHLAHNAQDPEVDVCAWFSGNMTLLATSPKKVSRPIMCFMCHEGSCMK